MTDVTGQFAAVNLAGPRAREIMARRDRPRRLARGDAVPRGRRGRRRRGAGDHPAHRVRGRGRLRDPRPGRLRRRTSGTR